MLTVNNFLFCINLFPNFIAACRIFFLTIKFDCVCL